jgi:phage-related protein
VIVHFYETKAGRSPIEDFILTLQKQDQARFAEVIDGIEKHNLNYARVQFRLLRGKLWEIKFSSHGGGYRIIYVMVTGNEMVWLHAFRKSTQKTPMKELDLAIKRMQEVLDL